MAAATFRFGSFHEAVDYFEPKVNLPTATWRDLRHGAHTRAFVVAGATEAALLEDFRGEVARAIEGKTTLDQFRKQFNSIVAKHGWQYNGSPGWRSRVIYNTNVRTAYMAGRYQQMTDSAVVAHMPWWQYDHTTIQNPREEHKAWDGLVLRHDDPFWTTHYPPNGWGCNCTVRPLSDRQLAKLGKTGPDPSPGANAGGVPEEWQYNVGEAAWGRPMADAAARKVAESQWTALPEATLRPSLADLGRPAKVPVDNPRATPYTDAPRDAEELRARWQSLFGDQTVLTDPAGGRVLMTGRTIDHWFEDPARRLDGRQQYLPLVRETIEDPFEIWAQFSVNAVGGYGVRRYYVRVVALDKNRSITLIANTGEGGAWVDFDVFRSAGQPARKIRAGHLVWGRTWP